MRKRKTTFPVIFALISLLAAQTTLYANPSKIVYLRSAETIVKVGQASWYSRTDPGVLKTTANNEIFDDTQLTAAMWDVPFNQMVRVTNLKNGKFVVVRINDRGPHRRLVREGRLIDLSKGAFETIASLDQGLIDIRLEIL